MMMNYLKADINSYPPQAGVPDRMKRMRQVPEWAQTIHDASAQVVDGVRLQDVPSPADDIEAGV
jgi:hypothetical protein